MNIINNYKSLITSINENSDFNLSLLLQSIDRESNKIQDTPYQVYYNSKLLSFTPNRIFCIYNSTPSISSLIGIYIRLDLKKIEDASIILNYIPLYKISKKEEISSIITKLVDKNIYSLKDIDTKIIPPSIEKNKLLYQNITKQEFDTLLGEQ